MSKAYIPQSKTVEWGTPQDLFNELNDAWHFTVDVAADNMNHKIKNYYDKGANGLKQDWTGEMVWCNPPYGREIKDWVKKAYESKANTVMLLPARTDVKWFHEYVYEKANYVIFIKGRLKFGGSKNNAPFPSMIVIFLKNLSDKRLWNDDEEARIEAETIYQLEEIT